MKEGVCNCLALRQATRHITAIYDSALAEAGLRSTQFSILYKLSVRGAMTINELSAVMVMDRTTLARNLKPLERDLLVKITEGVDRRERVVSLTTDGKAKMKIALPLWRKAQHEFESRFGSERASELRSTLRDVIASDEQSVLG
jgi:DNA-binding MarR family transcriptional regulator